MHLTGLTAVRAPWHAASSQTQPNVPNVPNAPNAPNVPNVPNAQQV